MLAVCAALATTTGLAHAGACVDQLTTLQQAPQLSHQPMLESVRQAQTYSELILSADLARAETLDAQGNEEKCREAARRGPSASAPPQHKTGNAQQCRRRKGLMRHTAVSCFPSTRVALRFSRSASRNSGKTRAGGDGGRNLGTWVSFRGPTPNL